MVGIGFVFILIFHFGTKEEKYRKQSSKDTSIQRNNNVDVESTISSPIPDDTISISTDSSASPVSQQEEDNLKTWKDWLKDSRLYKTAVIYMCTRMAINVYKSFFALYLTDALHFRKVKD